MTRIVTLPLSALRLIQRTIAAGLRAVSWLSCRENCGRTLTQVHSLRFLIHFISPRQTYRRLRVGDLLELCGFHRTASIEEAMRALQRVLKDYQRWPVPRLLAGDDSIAEILVSQISVLHHQSFWTYVKRFWHSDSSVLLTCRYRYAGCTAGISTAGIQTQALTYTSPESSGPFFAQPLSSFRKPNGQRFNYSISRIHGRILKLPLLLQNKTRIPKLVLRSSFRLAGSSAVRKFWFRIMLSQPVLSSKPARYGLLQFTCLPKAQRR